MKRPMYLLCTANGGSPLSVMGMRINDTKVNILTIYTDQRKTE